MARDLTEDQPGAGQVRVLGLIIGLTDVVTLGGLVFLILLSVAFSGRLEKPLVIAGRNLLLAAFYIASLGALRRIERKPLRFIVRTATVQFTFLQIFQTGCDLQRLFSGWQDDRVLAWEKAVFGSQPLFWIQRFSSPLFAEWMFFVYVVYIVIYPVLGAVIFFKKGEEANEDYLYQLAVVNLACSLGFIIFPVASPMYWPKVRELLVIPKGLGPFSLAAEYIRTHIHTPGGSIPSPHCAVATVMWFMAFKYTRTGFYLLAPVILSLYVSTVYGLFHYVSDMIIGIIAAVLGLLAAPPIARAWNRWADRLQGRQR